jgi:hypothetical protein
LGAEVLLPLLLLLLLPLLQSKLPGWWLLLESTVLSALYIKHSTHSSSNRGHLGTAVYTNLTCECMSAAVAAAAPSDPLLLLPLVPS